MEARKWEAYLTFWFFFREQNYKKEQHKRRLKTEGLLAVAVCRVASDGGGRRVTCSGGADSGRWWLWCEALRPWGVWRLAVTNEEWNMRIGVRYFNSPFSRKSFTSIRLGRRGHNSIFILLGLYLENLNLFGLLLTQNPERGGGGEPSCPYRRCVC